VSDATADATTAAGLHLDELEGWLDDHGVGAGPIAAAELLPGGTQNVLIGFTRGTSRYVLRRGPRHLRPRSNDAIRREMRILTALSATGVPHPRLIAACPDESVLGGAAFYVMERVSGFNATLELPPRHRSDARVRAAMGLELVDHLAALGATDHEALGLADFGRPEGFLQRQVPRWLGELEGYARHKGYPGAALPHVRSVADWLQENRPAAAPAGIMHGDYHLGNVLFSQDGPRLAAIVDWEMCTIGDPLLDLGRLLAVWPARQDRSDLAVGPYFEAGGFPAAEELAARYAARCDRNLDALTWYTVLGCFKLAVLFEGTYARAHAGAAPWDVGSRLHGRAVLLLERARRCIAAGG
jgi:aminoglycoside phosphotransferase (APT) family kinase protein